MRADYPLARRSFLSSLGLGATAVGFGAAPALASPAGGSSWQPGHHAQDDWLDQPKAKHRFVIDTTMPDGLGSGILYANNFLTANKDSYGLTDADSAVVIVMRHFSTPFAYNDAMWAKYGAIVSKVVASVGAPALLDAQTKAAPTINLYNSSAHVGALPSFGTTLDTLLKRGVQLAVCQMATRFLAGQFAMATKGNADEVYNELVANLVGNSHMVPAGIVAVNRAQEHGYSFAYA
jgi:intracellular sulfur oxidation DsrE/DsrF family protein